MSTFQDYVMNTFMYFRLGSTLNDEEHVKFSTAYALNKSCISQSVTLEGIQQSKINICVVSDTHDREYTLRNIPRCDVLVHCGDIMMCTRFFSDGECIKKLIRFNEWLGSLPAKHIIVVAGNHDRIIEAIGVEETKKILTNAVYLENSGVKICGLEFWGCPMSRGRSGNKAFQSDNFIDRSFRCCPDGGQIDILVTHGPCSNLAAKSKPRIAHLWGHAHESHGFFEKTAERDWVSICGSIMDAGYNPSHPPILLEVLLGDNQGPI